MESGYIRRLTEQWSRPICRYLIMSAKCNHSTIRLAAEHCIIVVNAVLTFKHWPVNSGVFLRQGFTCKDFKVLDDNRRLRFQN